MAQQHQQKQQQQQQPQRQPQPQPQPHTELQKLLGEDDEVAAAALELCAPANRSIYDKVHEQAKRFATTVVGQFVIERADRALKTIEDTIKWSMPLERTTYALDRPLPWLPFLALIVILRFVRIWLSIGALLIGNDPVTPADMAYFIQTRRRKLRAIRFHGLNVMRRREQEALFTHSGNANDGGFVSKLRSLWSLAICRPGMNYGTTTNSTTVYRRLPEDASFFAEQQKSVRADDENAMHNLTIQEMLAKYANENSEDDSDFVPDPEDEIESSSDSSSESESSQNETAEAKNGERAEEIANDVAYNNAHNQNVIIKENGKPFPKPMQEIKIEPISDVDSANEQQRTPQNGGAKPQETDVATPNANHTPQTTHRREHLAVESADDEDTQRKSTPGHESAAVVNTHLFNTTAAAADCEYANNTNAICVILTEPESVSESANESVTVSSSNANSIDVDIYPDVLSQTKIDISAVELAANEAIGSAVGERLESSTLTPATSIEDIFYSPIGSPSEFNNFYLPASLLINNTAQQITESNVLAQSTPTNETGNNSETSETESSAKKYETLTQQPQQQQQQPHQQQQRQHHSNRYRGRNRR